MISQSYQGASKRKKITTMLRNYKPGAGGGGGAPGGGGGGGGPVGGWTATDPVFRSDSPLPITDDTLLKPTLASSGNCRSSPGAGVSYALLSRLPTEI